MRSRSRLGSLAIGVDRLFGPLSSVAALKDVKGEVRLGATRRIEFRAFDYYWAGCLWTGKTYEEDVERTFARLASIPNKLFVDGGAKIGYWTVKLSEPLHDYARFIAVEANPAVHLYLQRNMTLDGIGGVALNAAIAERDGQIVHLSGAADHASASVGNEGIAVETVSVAGLLRRHGEDLPSGMVAVVKLDVEGSEIAAIDGAQGDHGFDLLFVFEDWPRSGMTVVAHLLAKGYDIAGIAEDGTAQRIANVADAQAFNRRNTRVYGPSNLIACRNAERFLPEVEAAGPASLGLAEVR